MGNDQRLNSRTILDQVFWAGVTPPSQADVQPPAKEAPHEPAVVAVAQAGLAPPEPEQVLEANISIQPEMITGADMAATDIGATADRGEPKTDMSEPEPAPAQEISTVSSPPAPPIVIDAEVAHREFRIMLQGAAPEEEAPPSDFGAVVDHDAPEAVVSEPEPADDIPLLSSPPLQPILIEDVDFADQPFQMEPQEAALADAWMRCVTTPARPRMAASA